jgi:hypothetical protein
VINYTCEECGRDHLHVTVTNRWRKVAEHIDTTFPDLIELDGEKYALCQDDVSIEEIEENYNNGTFHGIYTLSEIEEFGKKYVNLLVKVGMLGCICGGDKAKTTHSHWCHKHEG